MVRRILRVGIAAALMLAATLAACRVGPAGGEAPAVEPSAAAVEPGAAAVEPDAPSAVPADAPWFAPVLVVGDRAYVLRDPVPDQPPPADAQPLALEEVRAELRLGAPQEVSDGPEATVVTRQGRCAGRATQRAAVYSGCPGPAAGDGTTEPLLTRRTAWILDCPGLADPELGYTVGWAVEGLREELTLEPVGAEPLSDEDSPWLGQILAPYVAEHGLVDELGEAWSADGVLLVSGFEPQLVEVRGPLGGVLALVHGERLLGHLPPGFGIDRSLQVGEFRFVHGRAPGDCEVFYRIDGERLVPVADDCLWLWCGDGEL
jgi:hypothetical protein